MIGVLMSQKTLDGHRNKYTLRYPHREDISDIFSSDPRCLNLLHYASDMPPDGWTIERLCRTAGSCCDGFQFNVSWPSDAAMRRIFAHPCRYGYPRVVLQVGRRMLEEADGTRSLITRIGSMLVRFPDVKVLIDASGGSGTTLDVATTRSIVDDLRAVFPGLRITIAGGMCADTLPMAAPIVRMGVSIDAEGRLRDDAEGGGNLYMDSVCAYLRDAAEIINA